MMDSNYEGKIAAIEATLKKIDKDIAELQNRRRQLLSEKKDLTEHFEKRKKASSATKINYDAKDFQWSASLDDLIRSRFGISELRPLQLSTMNATLAGRDCLLVMPTGGGKSLCFQAPAMISRGVTLVVSPLVSLMEDQVMAMEKLNLPARVINATTPRSTQTAIGKDMLDPKADLKLLYVTPEKLSKSKLFMSKLQKMYEAGRFARLVIDEVHCCSQWGHDFRPDYKILGIFKKQFHKVPILGLTATATETVTLDVLKMLDLGTECLLYKAPFNRPNLVYQIVSKPVSKKDCLSELVRIIRSSFQRQSGIVYCLSIKETEEVADGLRAAGIRVRPYNAAMDAGDRKEVHQMWSSGKIDVIVATIAFGMGIDKPDVRFVIHYSISRGIENYYQESGRAGRDGQRSSCILFYRFQDVFRQSALVYAEKTGLRNLHSILAFAIDITRCRRSILAEYFGEKCDSSVCNRMCDNCNPALALGVQLLELWTKSNNGIASTAPNYPKEDLERIIAHLLVHDFLEEKFTFTAYATNSYLSKGLLSAILDDDTGILMHLPKVNGKSIAKVTRSPSVNSAGGSSAKRESSNSVESGKNAKKRCVGLIQKQEVERKVQKPSPDANATTSQYFGTLKQLSQGVVYVDSEPEFFEIDD